MMRWALLSSPAAKAALGLLLLSASLQASASSARGMVVDMKPIEGSSSCELVIDDEDLGRRLSILAEPRVCQKRGEWIGKRALFHLSLVDISGRLSYAATRVGPWPPRKD